jgi:hypothetical protein
MEVELKTLTDLNIHTANFLRGKAPKDITGYDFIYFPQESEYLATLADKGFLLYDETRPQIYKGQQALDIAARFTKQLLVKAPEIHLHSNMDLTVLMQPDPVFTFISDKRGVNLMAQGELFAKRGINVTVVKFVDITLDRLPEIKQQIRYIMQLENTFVHIYTKVPIFSQASLYDFLSKIKGDKHASAGYNDLTNW